MRDEIILNTIKDACFILDNIDEMINSQSNELQEIDYKISDWLHYIENNEVTEKESCKIIQELKKLRQIRRSLHKEYEIEKTYKEHSGKMMGNNTRGMLLAEINKTVKQLDNEYKNRILNEEDIKNILGEKKKKVGRPRKETKIRNLESEVN